MPGIDLPSGIKTLNPVPVEFWSGPYTGADETAAKLAANTAIPSAVRFLTMEVSLIIAGIGYKYWYKDGIADLDLVKVDTDISNLVTLNTNQTITGIKTFQNESLQLFGINSGGPHVVSVRADDGAGTIVFEETGDAVTQTVAYRSWVIDQNYLTSASISGKADKATTLTINGVSQDLSTNRSWSIDSLPSQTGKNGKWLTTDGTTPTWESLSGNLSQFTNDLANLTIGAELISGGSTYNGSAAKTIGIQAASVTNAMLAGSIDLTTKVTGLLPDGNISSASNWNTAYTNRITSLTTTGASGAATLISNVLNIPEYTLTGLGGVPTTRTLTIGQGGSATDLSADRTFLSNVPNVDATNASNISSGTLDDARLSSNVALKNTANTFTENQTISKSNPQVELVSATTAKASLLRGETTNTFSLTNDVLEIGGALSNCISFNNSNQYITSSPSGITGVTQWTVSFWINRTSQAATNVVYFGDGTNNYQITFCCGSTGHLGVYYNASINNWFSTTTVATSGWQHFVVTKDAGGTLRIYINGALNNTPVNAITNISNISSFRIGNVSGLPNINTYIQNAPTGQRIDQVLFYNTALTLGNVQSIYASGTSLPSTGNLLLRYELNEGTSTTTSNQGTASNGNGTLVNGVVWGIANGKIPTEAAIQLGTAINIRDGILNGERGQYRFGDPFGGTILRGRSIKFQSPLESNFSFIHNGTSTLIDPANTNTSATGASTVSVVGNASIGENVAAPTNGLRVVGNALFRANTFFGGTTTPTAILHMAAGTTSASSGQIKLNDGVNPSVAENGLINRVGSNVMFTADGLPYNFIKGFIGDHSSSITAETSITVTIGVTMPNTNYRVNITPTSTLAVGGYISDKTTTQFTYTFPINTGNITFDWMITQ